LIKIKPYYRVTHQIKDGENDIIEGIVTCCNANDFGIYVFGELKKSLFSRMQLLPHNEKLLMEARCNKCGVVIPLFDNSHDGYECCIRDNYEKTNCVQVKTQAFACTKCGIEDFLVSIKYEYPDNNELLDVGIVDTDNAFSWIWITLKCNNCGAIYKNFVDFETA
jgi:uncharacterized Zn finger protein